MGGIAPRSIFVSERMVTTRLSSRLLLVCGQPSRGKSCLDNLVMDIFGTCQLGAGCLPAILEVPVAGRQTHFGSKHDRVND